jgi:hypothetical protein
MRNADSEIKFLQKPVANQRSADENGRGDQRRAHRHLPAQRCGQTLRDAGEGRCQVDRVDDDQQGDERGDEESEIDPTGPLKEQPVFTQRPIPLMKTALPGAEFLASACGVRA